MSSIGFGNKEFSKWRQQFDRVVVKDQGGKPRSVKGYIVATRFATEAHPNVNSTIYAEDPESPGDHGLGPDDAPNLGRIVIDGHYSDIAGKLNQPILAAALGSGFRVPNEIQFQVVVWELLIGPNAGRRFVGGYYLPGGGSAPLREENKRLRVGISDPLRLDATWGAFFGVEETIFRQVVGMARGDDDALPRQLERFEQVQPFYSGASILRDGSIIAPVDFFAVVGQVTL